MGANFHLAYQTLLSFTAFFFSVAYRIVYILCYCYINSNRLQGRITWERSQCSIKSIVGYQELKWIWRCWDLRDGCKCARDIFFHFIHVTNMLLHLRGCVGDKKLDLAFTIRGFHGSLNWSELGSEQGSKLRS